MRAMKPKKKVHKSRVKVTIHPSLLARSIALANQRNLSLSEFVEDLIRLEIASPDSRSVYAQSDKPAARAAEDGGTPIPERDSGAGPGYSLSRSA